MGSYLAVLALGSPYKQAAQAEADAEAVSELCSAGRPVAARLSVAARQGEPGIAAMRAPSKALRWLAAGVVIPAAAVCVLRKPLVVSVSEPPGMSLSEKGKWWNVIVRRLEVCR